MNSFKSYVAAFALLISSSAFAAPHVTEDRALSSAQALKMEMYQRVFEMDIQNYNLEDCTVEVTYRIDENGQVEVVATAGPSQLAGEYVKLKMEAMTISVSPALQNTNQTINLRYVVL